MVFSICNCKFMVLGFHHYARSLRILSIFTSCRQFPSLLQDIFERAQKKGTLRLLCQQNLDFTLEFDIIIYIYLYHNYFYKAETFVPAFFASKKGQKGENIEAN